LPPTAAAAAAPTTPAATPPAPTRIQSGPVPPSAAAAGAAAAGAAAAGAAAAAPPHGPIPSGPVPQSARKESPLDVFEAEDGKRRWPRRLLIALGVVVVLAAAYVGASYGLADRVPRGATVAGVDIGGLTSKEAVARLDQELADATTQPIEVVANDVQATIDPVAAGLSFDSQATVDELTGVNLAEPRRLWQHIGGVGEQEPVTSVDDKALAAALSDLGTSLALAPVDGTIVFVDATAQSTAAVDGWDLDQDGAAHVLSADWLVAARPIELPTVTVEPDITQAETDAALTEAQKVTSAPVSVMVSEQIAMLDVPTLAANAAYVPTDGNLVLQMNGQGLSDAVLAQLPDLLTASADAHFEFVNDAPVIVPGTPGTSLDPAALATSVATAATSSDRTAHVELVEADPAQSTAELEALGVKEIVSEFSTPLTSEPRRTVNITNGASKISGTLIRPDETFSLTDALGPIDAAHGFVEAGAIVSGEHTDAWGGGLSQISTTTYNAAFLAGFEDIEHRPHSEWFARYPEGREATIFTGTLDMRWKNNTPYGALVQAWVSEGRVYVRVWGTKYWTVESITSPRSGVVAPTTVYSQSPTCEASSAGNPGFSVTVTRKTYLNGELKKTESNSWRYKPQNKIICGAAPTPTPTP
ncbi:VanW family protein, partial [Cellulomonas sp. P5_C6]